MSDPTEPAPLGPRWQVYEDPNPPADGILRWPNGEPYRMKTVLAEGFVYAPYIPDLPPESPR